MMMMPRFGSAARGPRPPDSQKILRFSRTRLSHTWGALTAEMSSSLSWPARGAPREWARAALLLGYTQEAVK